MHNGDPRAQVLGRVVEIPKAQSMGGDAVQGPDNPPTQMMGVGNANMTKAAPGSKDDQYTTLSSELAFFKSSSSCRAMSSASSSPIQSSWM